MKKTILHIIGTTCSGKSTVINNFKDSPLVASWDIQDWYKEENIIKGTNFNIEAYMNKRFKIWPAFRKFAKQNKNAYIYILESSGSNKEIQYNIKKTRNKDKINIIEKALIPPPKDILIERAKQRDDITVEKVLEFADLYYERRNRSIEMNQKDLINLIKEMVNTYETAIQNERRTSNQN